MANLKEIRSRIKSVQNTQQTTRAMKMVSAAKLRRAQESIEDLRPYALKLRGLLQNLSRAMANAEVESPYLEPRESIENVLVIVVTSNRGLAGAFNANACKLGMERIQEYPEQLASGKLQVLCIGRKGHDFFRARGIPVLESRNFDVFDGLSFDTVRQVAERVMDDYAAGTYDRIELVYNEFKNVAVQERQWETYLPVTVEAKKEEDDQQVDYLFEPGPDEILTELIPRIIKLNLFRAVLESHAAEHGARMMAMDAATDNAQTLLNDLKLSYNKARQAAITTEILEIVSGANALEGG